MDPSQEFPKYPKQHGQDVDVSDLNTETLAGLGAVAPCLLPSEGELMNSKSFTSAFLSEATPYPKKQVQSRSISVSQMIL